MTTTTRNEAAERLRVHLRNREQSWFGREDQWTEIERQMDEALAAERRATVERIRDQIPQSSERPEFHYVLRILDEEAAR